MVRTRRPTRASAALACAADGIAADVREHRTADHEELRESGRQLTRLTGGLTDLVALPATELAGHGRDRLLRAHEGTDAAASSPPPPGNSATCARRWTPRSARPASYCTALSGLTVDVDLSACPGA